MIWFTADPHFGHENIIKYCNRPFKNVKIMDQTIIRNHNGRVGSNDDVYILGDFSLKPKRYREDYRKIVSKLNGKLHLIMGNHDIKDPTFYIDVGFHSVHYPYFEVKEFICVHDPSISTINSDKKFLCGHIHNLFLKIKNCLNVGVDIHNFNPISIDEVREIWNK